MKAMKKVFAMLLALAMIVTAVPVNSASAATYNMKAGSAGIISKTLYAGRSHTLKLNGYKASQIKSTKWSVGKTSVVKLASTTKTTAKMTCVGKGYTVVTAKMTLTNKKVKTFKAKITVKNPSVSAETAEVAVGKTTQLTVVAKPTNAKLAYESDNTDVATVSDQGIVTGVKAGTANVTVTLTCGTKKKTATAVVTVKEAEPEKAEINIVSFAATAKDTFTATFATPVDEKAVVSITRAGQTAAVDGKGDWNTDRTELTYKTTANLAAGTYTLKVTVGEGDAAVSATKDTEVSELKAVDIVFYGETALTGGEDSGKYKEAYVYYDVIDQYNNSLRSTTSITWSTSPADYTVDKATGRITLKKSDGFTLIDMVTVVAVSVKDNISKSVTLKVGMAQAAAEVKMAGFVKKNGSTILKELPPDFKTQAYYLLYSVTDQNGNPMKADDYIAKEQVQFVTKDFMLVEGVEKVPVGAAQTVTIDGVEYCAGLVKPGMQVSTGGSATIEAYGLKTGTPSTLTFHVGPAAILTSFEMVEPTHDIMEGDEVTIAFKALDQNGNEIKDFVSLAKNEIYNKLTLNVATSVNEALNSWEKPNVKLSENNDGTATLKYTDTGFGWGTDEASNGIDRLATITAIVVGGDNKPMIQLHIKDKRRPVAIKSLNIAKVLVEGGKTSAGTKNDDDKYIDQYGAELAGSKAYDFFKNADGNGGVKGLEFADYDYDVKMIYAGNGKVTNDGAAFTATDKDTGIAKVIGTPLIATGDVVGVAGGETLKFEIVRQKKGKTDWETVSPTYSHTITVVDITQIKSLSLEGIDDLLYVTTDSSTTKTFDPQNEEYLAGGVYASLSKADWLKTAVTTTGGAVSAVPGLNFESGKNVTYRQKEAWNGLRVVGKYNGESVTIPSFYWTIEGDKITASVNEGGEASRPLKEKTLDTLVESNVKWNELYDETSAQFVRKTATGTLNARVYEVYSNGGEGKASVGTNLMPDTTTAGAIKEFGILYESITKTVKFSDANPEAVEVQTSADSYTVNPTTTHIDVISEQRGQIAVAGASWAQMTWDDPTWHPWYRVVDQYGKKLNVDIKVKISEAKEAVGYADNNFAVSENDSVKVDIDGAERDDTFKLTIYVADKPEIAKTVTFTVGADNNAYIDKAGNAYLDTLVKELEKQRKAGLGVVEPTPAS